MKSLLKGLLVIMFAAMLSGCGMMFNNDDEDSNSEQQEPTSSDSDLSGNNSQDDSAEDAGSSSVSEDNIRLVSLMPSNTEILDSLGFTEEIVGISSVDTYPESLVEDDEIAKIDSFDFNAEQILDLEPTHIFSHETSEDVHGETLEEIGEVTDAEIFYIKDAENIDDIYETVSEIGGALDAEDKAEEVNEELNERVDHIVSEYKDSAPAPNVFIQIAPYPDVFTSGSNTFIDDVIQQIGADNAFSDLEGFAQVSAEEILEREPDYIVSIIDDYDENTLQEDIEKFSAAEHMDIANEENQCVLDPDLLARPSPRIDEGLESLAECLFE